MAASAGVFFYCTGHSDERFRKNHILTELVFGDMLRDECKLEKTNVCQTNTKGV